MKCKCDAVTEQLHVDERVRFRCSKCGAAWYSDRGWTNPRYSALDEIAESIADTSFLEICEPADKPGTFDPCGFTDLAADLAAWAKTHGYTFQTHVSEYNGALERTYMFEWPED
ncbi:hypothetical protein D0B54_02530 [Solimonas sp. K1W22B-7]|uniref:hypothetical protein n=1 Tax=Solimonas sp. K1W22B-7 TaxID=2303331 RepID=UPI000E32F795|nr:hypothetical protein [Solimonas sp. K1W22B-7]AXQ27618.1 hypothetical protein D0B54_02530 [Solimonas sp. K1W22B-7]